MENYKNLIAHKTAIIDEGATIGIIAKYGIGHTFVGGKDVIIVLRTNVFIGNNVVIGNNVSTE